MTACLHDEHIKYGQITGYTIFHHCIESMRLGDGSLDPETTHIQTEQIQGAPNLKQQSFHHKDGGVYPINQSPVTCLYLYLFCPDRGHEVLAKRTDCLLTEYLALVSQTPTPCTVMR